MTEPRPLQSIERLRTSGTAVALVTSLLATAATHVLLPVLAASVFHLFLLAVLISSLYGGLWPGVIATVLSCAGVILVALEPAGEPYVGAPLDAASLSTLAVFGVVIAILAQAMRTARARARQRELVARTGEESFRAIFDNTADAIYVTGAVGQILNVNDAAARIHGESREDLIGRNWQSLVDTERSDLARLRAYAEAAFSGQPASYEVWVLHQAGRSVQLEMRITDARYFGRNVLIAVARDLTERRRLEAELRQSQKMEAIGRLAGGVAHDFNNLLTSIRGNASLMRDRLAHDPSLLDDLTEIESAADMAAAVTRQLLAFSRKQDYLPHTIMLNDSLDRIESLLRRLLDERIELAVERDPELGRTLLDPGQFEQVVMNLVINARDAIRGTGRITVRTSNVDPGAAGTAGTAGAAGTAGTAGAPLVALSVTDTGIGMDDALRARIFEPFFTTKESAHGTGLGLSTVYGIVQQSGGTIDVQSALGHGSTVTVLFPGLVASPLPAQPAPVAKQPAAPGDRERTVLLAEDETPVRHLVRRVLTRGGYAVVEAANGREALDVAHTHEGVIDALVTDVIMPEMTGPELAEALRAENPSLPVLFTSGYNDQGMEDSGVVSGLGIAFLQKPFVPDELIRMLGELLEPGHPH